MHGFGPFHPSPPFFMGPHRRGGRGHGRQGRHGRRGPHGPPPWVMEMFGGGRRRAERGEVRYLVLDAVANQPGHGYEVIPAIEASAGGGYRPSPGTIYPTLQLLEEMALVSSDRAAGKRVYEITDAGRAELATQRDLVEEAYERLGGEGALEDASDLFAVFDRLPRLFRRMVRGLRRGRIGAAQVQEIRQIMEQAADRIEVVLEGQTTHPEDE
jgi:DNA-binding PadR family transcriptional regulator